MTVDPGAIDHFGAEANAYFELHDLCFENRTIASVCYFCFRTRIETCAHVFSKYVHFAVPNATEFFHLFNKTFQIDRQIIGL